MIVKKFQGATEKEAILKAQEELGNNAVVLNVKTLKQRGIFKLFKKDVVEITAALEEDEYVNKNVNKDDVFNKAFVQAGAAYRTEGTVSGSVPSTGGSFASQPVGKLDFIADEKLSVPSESTVIEQKLDSLHSLLQSQMNSGSGRINDMKREDDDERSRLDTERDAGRKAVQERENSNMKFIKLIYNKLIDNEVDEKYADQIMGDIESSLKRESNIDSILSAVYQKIILKLGEPKPIELGDKPKAVFFIGPTGVGKTTTIAKIASKFKLEEYARVAFVTADTYRIAAVEQLNTYASIIDSPVSVVYSSDELDEALREYKDYDLIMIDTAGRSHKSEEQMDELSEMLERAEELKDNFDVEIYLVLSTTTKYKDLVNITERYKDVKNWSVIFTKLDETCCLGNILNIRLLTGARLSYTTSGQNVPNDIELINEQALAKQLLGGSV